MASCDSEDRQSPPAISRHRNVCGLQCSGPTGIITGTGIFLHAEIIRYRFPSEFSQIPNAQASLRAPSSLCDCVSLVSSHMKSPLHVGSLWLCLEMLEGGPSLSESLEYLRVHIVGLNPVCSVLLGPGQQIARVPWVPCQLWGSVTPWEQNEGQG